MTITTCAGCGKSYSRNYWIHIAGRMWHPDCYEQDMKRRRLADRPIKERHDGPSTRHSRGRSTTG